MQYYAHGERLKKERMENFKQRRTGDKEVTPNKETREVV
jgi:hypothetical protein